MKEEDCSTSRHSDNAEHREMEQVVVPKVEVHDEDETLPESATSSRDENERLRDLHRSVTCLSHQMALIMRALHLPPCQCEVCLSQGQNNVHHNEMAMLNADYGQRLGGGKLSMADRRTVHDYAFQHGGMAAVRRFGVPAPVSSYYQRSNSHGKLPANTSSSPSTDGERNGQEASSSAPDLGRRHSPVEAMLKMTSPSMTGLQRGRGRGRPKLIGDELDADLVEYMIQLHNNDVELYRMSAPQALDTARAYIMHKAPGLLEEQGGHVKLKLTWAMKLVSRIAERQKEMELGLLPGTLQSIVRAQQSTKSGTRSPLERSGGTGEEEVNAPLEALQHHAPSTPEVVNVRELDLSTISSTGPMDASPSEKTDMPSSGELPLIADNGEVLFPLDHQYL